MYDLALPRLCRPPYTALPIGLGCLLTLLGCPDDPETEPPAPDEPCDEVTCSGHGTCVEVDGEAACECDFLYHAEGLECVADELPDLTCEGGIVTHHLDEPLSERAPRRASQRRPLRLRNRAVPADLSLCDPVTTPSTDPSLLIVELASGTRAVKTLGDLGLARLSPMGHGFQLAVLPAGVSVEALCAESSVLTVEPLLPTDRIGSRLARRADSEQVDVTVVRLDPTAAHPYDRYVREHVAQMTAAQARQLARDPLVLVVDERDPSPLPLSDVARRAVHTEEVAAVDLAGNAPSYAGPAGRGVRLAVVDTGVDADHMDLHLLGEDGEDLGSRVVGDPPHTGDSHGTNVAGVATSNGYGSDGYTIEDQTGEAWQWRGHAPAIEQVASVYMSFNDTPWIDAFVEHDAHLSNHSYTQSMGDYSVDIALFDEVIREGAAYGGVERPPRVTLFAAANNGSGPGSNSELQGFYSILAPGKNPITVGGSNANDDTYSMAASAGPTLDGRLKPDLIAPGYKEYRPPEGVGLEIDEIALVAAAGSGEPDLVWSFDTDGDSEGWVLGSCLLDAVVADGAVQAVAVESNEFDDESLVYDLAGNLGYPIDANVYEELQVTMRMDVGGTAEQHRWPYFWVTSWDGSGDGAFDGNTYPAYDPALQDDQWHTHSLDLAGIGAWDGDIYMLRVWPASYDYRMIIPAIGGGYDRSGGTSLASPVAAGVVAMAMERLRDDHGVDLEAAPPLPSTFKALLVHTARDLVQDEPLLRDPPNPDTGEGTTYLEGPDFASGYGLLDALAVMAVLDAHGNDRTKIVEGEVDDGEEVAWLVPVVDAAGGSVLKVTLAWDDAPGSGHLGDTEPVLVNDLDLVLVDPEGGAYTPWVLDPLPMDDDVWDGVEPIDTADVVPARRAHRDTWWDGDDSWEDHRNNLEQVVADAPAEGWYLVRVRGTDVPEGPQRFSLVLTQACD